MKRRRLLTLLALAICALTAAPLAQAANSVPVVVLAASSLTGTLPIVAAGWTAQGHPPVVFSFDASSRLAKQIEAGAPADAFISADVGWMDALGRAALLVPGTRRDLVGNALVAVVPAASALRLVSPADLARPTVARLGMAGENVPAGRYGRAALRALGVWDSVQGRVVNGDNVRSVLGWVATSEVSAGIVYATDARVEPRVRVAFPFAADTHPPIVYPMAVVRGAARAAEASAFLDYCASAEGRAIFLAGGFTLPPDVRLAGEGAR